MQETRVRFLGWEVPLERGMAIAKSRTRLSDTHTHTHARARTHTHTHSDTRDTSSLQLGMIMEGEGNVAEKGIREETLIGDCRVLTTTF